MGIAKKSGSSTSGMVARLVGTATKAGTTGEQSADEIASQRKVRKILQRDQGAQHGNVNRTDSGVAPDLDAFLRGQEYSRFASSNVRALQYDPTTHQLYVRYGGKARRVNQGRWYRYDSVTDDEARLFWGAASKGGMVWELLRVRGTKEGHKKSFTPDAAPPAYLPIDQAKRKTI